MQPVPLRASIEPVGYEDNDGDERWSYAVTAGPVGAPDNLVAGLLWTNGRGTREVDRVDQNGLGISDDLARRFLVVIFRGLYPEMAESDCDTAQYSTPDCTAWISGKMYGADASRVLRALAQRTQVTQPFKSTLWVSQ